MSPMMISTQVSERRGACIDALRLDPIRDRKLVQVLYLLAQEADALERAVPRAEETILALTKLRRERPLRSDEYYQLSVAKVHKAEAVLASDLFLDAVEAVKRGELA